MHIDYHNPSPNHAWPQYWSLGVLSALLEWPYQAWALLCHPCPLCTICAGLSLCLSLFWQVQQDRTCFEPSRAGITHHPLIGFVPPPIHLTSDILTIFSWNVIDFSSFHTHTCPIWSPPPPCIAQCLWAINPSSLPPFPGVLATTTTLWWPSLPILCRSLSTFPFPHGWGAIKYPDVPLFHTGPSPYL